MYGSVEGRWKSGKWKKRVQGGGNTTFVYHPQNNNFSERGSSASEKREGKLLIVPLYKVKHSNNITDTL